VSANGFFVIGEEELVIAFRFAGVSGYATRTREETLEAFDRARSSGASVAILSEDVADLVRLELNDHQLSGAFPLIVEMPPLEGSSPGRTTLLESIREAVGVRI
jgi:V/A-type H+-transporting ATPase subunit F